MKKILPILVLVLTSCTFDEITSVVDYEVDLGTPAMENNISYNPITGIIHLTLTPGAVYSLQVVDITGNVVKKVVVEGDILEQQLSVSQFLDLPRNVYDLVLIDNHGNFSKTSLII